MVEERAGSPLACELSFPRRDASPLLSEGRPGSPPLPEAEHTRTMCDNVLESPRWAQALVNGADISRAITPVTPVNTSLLLAESESEFQSMPSLSRGMQRSDENPMGRRGSRAFTDDSRSTSAPRARLSDVPLSRDGASTAFSEPSQAPSDMPPPEGRTKRRSKHRSSKSGRSTAESAESAQFASLSVSLPAGMPDMEQQQQQQPKQKRRTSQSKVKGSTQELSIEERLDLQLQEIMRSKSKLAIAMERVSADMHIKKRDREIVRLRKEVAEYTHSIHKQKEALTTQGEAYNELQTNVKALQKRNLRMLQKQRHYDEMKKQLSAVMPEESTEELAARVKKEVMAKMERTLYELKHARNDLAEELRHEQASNHKANAVISELEVMMEETNSELSAAKDQVHVVMTAEAAHIDQIDKLTTDLDKVMAVKDKLQIENDQDAEVRARLCGSLREAEELSTALKERNTELQTNWDQLHGSLASAAERADTAEAQMFEQSKRHAVVAGKVCGLQEEVALLHQKLKEREEEQAEEAALARDVVVGQLNKEVEQLNVEKRELEVALGKLVGESERAKLDHVKEGELHELTMEKALKKVEKLPQTQQKLHEEMLLKEAATDALAVATVELNALKADAERAAAAEVAWEKGQVELNKAHCDAAALQQTIKQLEAQLAAVKDHETKLGESTDKAIGDKKAAETSLAEFEATLTTRIASEQKALLELDGTKTERELLQSELAGQRVTMTDIMDKLRAEREKSLGLQHRIDDTTGPVQVDAGHIRENTELKTKIETLEAEIARLRGAPKGRRHSSDTIFTLMRQERWEEVMQLMSSAGFDHSIADGAGFSLMMVASQHGARDAVAKLGQLGADTNAKNQHGQTPLHLCFPDNQHVAGLLVELGADQTIRDNAGKLWNEAATV